MSTSMTPPEGDVVDWDVALDRVAGDRDTLHELVDIFLDQWPAMMDEIEQSVARGEYSALRRSAHTLKGSAAIFGAHRVTDVAGRLSDMGKDQRIDHADQALRTLQDEIDKLIPALEAKV